MDPLVDATGQPYAYTGDDPVNGTDPSGMCWPSFACGAENAATSLAAGAGDYAVSAIQTGAEATAASFSGVLSPATFWLENQYIPNLSISNPICQDASWYTGGYWGAAAAGVIGGGAAGWADGASAAGEVGASDIAAGLAPTVAEESQVPESAQQILDYIESHNGSPPPGYKGGSTFDNDDGTLPPQDSGGDAITYREYDVNPNQKGVDRDDERVVVGSNGAAYYTNDHYNTFVPIR